MDNLHCDLDLHVIMSAMSRTPRHLAVTAMITGLALLGACSNGDDNAKPSDKLPSGSTATTEPTKTSAAPTSTTPTKTPAPKPTKQGAIDTAIAGIKAIDHAYATWDTKALRKISTTACENCQQIITTFPVKRAAGYEMSGGRITITGPVLVADGSTKKGTYFIRIPIKISPLVTHDPDGHLYQNSTDSIGSGPGVPQGSTMNILVGLDRNDEWQVTGAGVQQ